MRECWDSVFQIDKLYNILVMIKFISLNFNIISCYRLVRMLRCISVHVWNRSTKYERETDAVS